MTGFFKNLFKSRSNEQNIDDLTQDVTMFMHACKMHVEQRDLMVPRKYTLFYVYALGAISARIEDQGGDDTTAYAVLLQVITRTSQLSASDVSSMLGQCMQARNTPSGETFFQQGYENFQAWRSKQRDVSKDLAALLIQA